VKAAAARFRTIAAGLPPERMALILALGLVLGVFPMYGLPTTLCVVAAMVLRVNLPALQLVNQLSSPLQLALWLPMARVGAWAAGSTGGWNLADTARFAVIGWFCLCLPVGVALYCTLLFALRRNRLGWFNGLRVHA